MSECNCLCLCDVHCPDPTTVCEQCGGKDDDPGMGSPTGLPPFMHCPNKFHVIHSPKLTPDKQQAEFEKLHKEQARLERADPSDTNTAVDAVEHANYLLRLLETATAAADKRVEAMRERCMELLETLERAQQKITNEATDMNAIKISHAKAVMLRKGVIAISKLTVKDD